MLKTSENSVGEMWRRIGDVRDGWLVGEGGRE